MKGNEEVAIAKFVFQMIAWFYKAPHESFITHIQFKENNLRLLETSPIVFFPHNFGIRRFSYGRNATEIKAC